MCVRNSMMVIWVSSVMLFLSCFCGIDGVHWMRCTNRTETSTTLRPSDDGVMGRYIVEWCTAASPKDIHWKCEVSYSGFYPLTGRYNKRIMHSVNEEYLNWTEPMNCEYVCLSTFLDVMFKENYTIYNYITSGHSIADITKHEVANNYSIEDFFPCHVDSSFIDHGDYVSVKFYSNTIPIAPYYNVINKKYSAGHEEEESTFVDDNCTAPHTPYEVICKLRLPAGTYKVEMDFIGPWKNGVLKYVISEANFISRLYYTTITVSGGSVVPTVGGAAGGAGGAGAVLAWAGGAAATLAALALALLLALRCRRTAHFRKQVLRTWLHREDTKPVPAEPAPTGPVLLLYARECSAAEPIISALKSLLETVAPGQVYDVCSAQTQALAAADGGAWVRGVLARRGARVVLLQTPALRALHTPRLVTDGGPPRLEQPLLWSRALYAAPAPGDWLLQFALRLLAAPPHAQGPHPYKKYFLATLEGLETEALPYTVPFRRYVLPRHTHTLLQDLRSQPQSQSLPPSQSQSLPPSQSQATADELARTITDFVDYARANPDYLMNELLIL